MVIKSHTTDSELKEKGINLLKLDGFWNIVENSLLLRVPLLSFKSNIRVAESDILEIQTLSDSQHGG